MQHQITLTESRLEQMTYDFATGKTDGEELVKFVMENIDA